MQEPTKFNNTLISPDTAGFVIAVNSSNRTAAVYVVESESKAYSLVKDISEFITEEMWNGIPTQKIAHASIQAEPWMGESDEHGVRTKK